MNDRPVILTALYRAAPIALVLVTMTATPAHAYIDPGAGAVVVTTILGLIGAIGYTFRAYMAKLKHLVARKPSDDDGNPRPNDASR